MRLYLCVNWIITSVLTLTTLQIEHLLSAPFSPQDVQNSASMKPTWPVMAWVSTDRAVGSLPCNNGKDESDYNAHIYIDVTDRLNPVYGFVKKTNKKKTYNLHRSYTPNQLLQQSCVTVRKLANALSDKLLLVDGEAVALPALQQTAGKRSNSHTLWQRILQRHTRLHLLMRPSSLSSWSLRKEAHFPSTQLM